MTRDIKVKKTDYWCGYCNNVFTMTLLYEHTPFGVKVRDKRITCPRCNNMLKRIEDAIE